MSRYEDATGEVLELLADIRGAYFPELENAYIKILFDTKKVMQKGKLTVARIQKTNDLHRYLTQEEVRSELGYDYFLYLDKRIWEVATDDDKIKILRHELCHTDVDLDKDAPYGLRGHEISDFYSEIDRNKDDPEWAAKLVEVGLSLYEK